MRRLDNPAWYRKTPWNVMHANANTNATRRRYPAPQRRVSSSARRALTQAIADVPSSEEWAAMQVRRSGCNSDWHRRHGERLVHARGHGPALADRVVGAAVLGIDLGHGGDVPVGER